MKFNQIIFDLFCSEFGQQIIRGSEEDGTTHEDKFTELILDALEEADETENTFIAYHKKTGIKVNGYGINDSGEVLDLFVSEYSGQIPAVSIPKSEIESAFKRAENFFEKSVNGYYRNLEEAQPVYDLSDRIFRFSSDLRKIRFFLLTDKTSRLEEIKEKKQGGFTYTYQVWDIGRYHNLVSSGKSRESITIKIKDEFESLLPCLNEGGKNPVYTSYLAVMPGKTLVKLYDEYGPRLLERNVRSFLQVRGNVNKGIKNTVLKDPEMFLAYNNGLSTTAEEVTTEVIDGRTYITQIRDFQIVNGAQTTATIHDTYVNNKNAVDLESIYVPMKLTVLKDSSELNEFVPKISQYSNTQNKIDMADFSSNHPFHMKMEEISARLRAPSKEGIQLESYWFYERVRGQYLNKRNREMTPARKKVFDKVYPKNQKIEKTELPVYEHTWQMKPWEVSLGKQKNYKLFMNELASGNEIVPDEKYFADAVAKAILYKETYSIVRKELEGGYRPNIVTYAIAYLNYKTKSKISLDRIWKEQGICDELRNVLSQLVRDIQQFIITAPEGRNVTEFCKKKECWYKLQMEKFELDESVSAAFSTTGKVEYSFSPLEELIKSEIPASVFDNTDSRYYGDKLSVEYNKPADDSGAALISSSNPERSVPSSVEESPEYINHFSVSIGPSDDRESLLKENAEGEDNFSMVLKSPEKTDSSFNSQDKMSEPNLDGRHFVIKQDDQGKKSSLKDADAELLSSQKSKSSGSFIKRPPKKSAPASVGRVSQKDWEKIAEWGLDTGNLDPEQQDVAARFASSAESDSYRSPDLMLEGLVVLNIAKEKGFEFSSNSKLWQNNSEGSDTPFEKTSGKTSDSLFVSTEFSGISDDIIELEIVRVLKKHGGKCRLTDIIEELGSNLKDRLTEYDLEKHRFGYPRWRIRVMEMKSHLVDIGILQNRFSWDVWALNVDSDAEDKNNPLGEINLSSGKNRQSITDEKIEEDIIRVLAKKGGSAHLSLILSELEDMWRVGVLSKDDRLRNKAGSIRWRSRVVSMKTALIENDILTKKTPAGLWVLSDSIYKFPGKYKEILKDHKKLNYGSSQFTTGFFGKTSPFELEKSSDSANSDKKTQSNIWKPDESYSYRHDRDSEIRKKPFFIAEIPNAKLSFRSSSKESGYFDHMIEMELIKILKNHGGKCKLSDIIEIVAKEYESPVGKCGFEGYKSNYSRWRTRIMGLESRLIENGVLDMFSRDGIWILHSEWENTKIQNSYSDLYTNSNIPAGKEFTDDLIPIKTAEKENSLDNSPDNISVLEKVIIRILFENEGSAEMNFVIDEMKRLTQMNDTQYFCIPKDKEKLLSTVMAGKWALIEAGLLEDSLWDGEMKLTPKAVDMIKAEKN